MMRDLNELFRSTEHLRSLLEGVRNTIPPEVLRGIDEQARFARDAIGPEVLRAIEEQARIIQQAMPSAEVIRSLAEQARLWKSLVEEREREYRLLAPFEENSLCLAPSMPDELVEACERRHEKGLDVVGYVVSQYRRNRWQMLLEMVGSWKDHPYLGPRMHIIEEALWAHTRRHFVASTALLVHQPEGIVLDWVYAADDQDHVAKKSRGLREERERRQRDGELADDILVAYATHYVTMIPGMLPASALNKRQRTCMRSFVKFVYRLFYRVHRPFKNHVQNLQSNDLMRHAIAHGSAVQSGTDANSLRLFLALDVLALVHE